MTFATFIRSAAIALAVVLGAGTALAGSEVPAPGQSPKIDAIKQRGVLKAAAIGEFPWLPENTSGSGPQFSGPAWVLAEEYAKRLGVKLEIVPVSHETKVPILATGEADISIAPLSVTPKRQQVADFVVYSHSSLCMFGLAANPKLKDAKTVDDLNREDITIAYFTGTPPETWAPTRFPKAKLKGVAGSGANAPIEEIMAKRADIASIDNVAWPQLQKQVPGLVSFPRGDECLQSKEMATEVGLAVDKKDPAFHAWLQAVYDEMKDKVTAEELRLLKGQ
jgi:polar amino acid transport system substrate-binding protein